MRILADENIPLASAFAAYGELEVFPGRELTRDRLRGADALLVRSVTRVNRALLEGTGIRFVGTATIGVDHVDQDYLREENIGFASAPGCNARSVAEYVAAALLHLEKERGLKLEGAVLGIVGYGHVGKQVARIAEPLGLEILLCDPPLAAAGGMGFVPLPALLEQSDIVTLHVPLVDSGAYPTAGMADGRFFKAFRRGKAFLNTARGEVVDEGALLQAMEAGLSCVLDVFRGEPRPNPALSRAELITPHIAGYSVEGKVNGTRQVLEAFCRHFGFAKSEELQGPDPDFPEIRIPAQPGSQSYLHYCVTHVYDIRRDDAELRRALRSEHPDAGFDALRRLYPPRHEFSKFRVSGLSESQFALRSRLLDLGFSNA